VEYASGLLSEPAGFRTRLAAGESSWHGRMASWRVKRVQANVECQDKSMMNDWQVQKKYWVSSMIRQRSVRAANAGTPEENISVSDSPGQFNLHV
jgi:hypothetical protein